MNYWKLKSRLLKEIFHIIDLLKEEILKSSDIEKKANILYELEDFDANVDYGVVLKDGYIDMTLYNSFYDNQIR